jgi:hypothetical protein
LDVQHTVAVVPHQEEDMLVLENEQLIVGGFEHISKSQIDRASGAREPGRAHAGRVPRELDGVATFPIDLEDQDMARVFAFRKLCMGEINCSDCPGDQQQRAQPQPLEDRPTRYADLARR